MNIDDRKQSVVTKDEGGGSEPYFIYVQGRNRPYAQVYTGLRFASRQDADRVCRALNKVLREVGRQ